MPNGQRHPQQPESSAPANPTAGALLVATAPAPATPEAEALLWRPLRGRSLAAWPLAALVGGGGASGLERPRHTVGLEMPDVVAVVIVARAERQAEAAALTTTLPPTAPPVHVVAGEPDWRASLAAGLAALPDDCVWVIILDAARPLITDAMVSGGLVAARDVEGMGMGAAPVSDTLKRVVAGRVVETPRRATLRHLTPPLVIHRSLLARALQTIPAPDATGLAAVALASGARLALYTLASPNPAVTSDADMAFVEALLAPQPLPGK